MEYGLDFPGILAPEGQNDSKYIRLETLGSGSFAKVWVVQRRSDGKHFAAKILQLRGVESRAQQRAKSEINCLQSCKHFACLQFIEHFYYDNRILIIVEFCNAGDLASYIEGCKSSGRPFPESTISIILLQLILALNHMHRKKIVHRDIKSKNIFLSTTGLVKIGDFGLSNEYETISRDGGLTFCGTPIYLAPEVWRRERYGVRADIWALGVLTYELIMDQCPFVGADMQTLKHRVLDKPYPPIPPDHVSGGLIEVVDMMLQKNPMDRPTTLQLLKVPYIRIALDNFLPTVNNTDRLSDEMKQSVAEAVREVEELLAQPEKSPPAELSFKTPVRKLKNDGIFYDRYLVLYNRTLEILSSENQCHQRHPLSINCVKEVIPVEGNAKLFVIYILDGHCYTFESEHRDEWVSILNEVCSQVDNK